MPWQTEKPKAREPLATVQDLNTRVLQVKSTALNSRAAPAVSTAPTAADLAPTLETEATPEIQQLATQLQKNPLQIYNWVHDNVHYFPSYGSVQGAHNTLDKKSGNAFDTASLTIALLRILEILVQTAIEGRGGTQSRRLRPTHGTGCCGRRGVHAVP